MVLILNPKISDRLLKDLKEPSVEKAWALTNQFIIDLLFPLPKRKFTALNILNDKQAPCSPGSVLLVKERNFKEWLMRRKTQVVFAALLPDFYKERTLKTVRDVGCLRQQKPIQVIKGLFVAHFESLDGTKAVKVEFDKVELNSVEAIDTTSIRLALDNFSNTGFHDDLIYVVKSTITTDHVRITVRVDGLTKVFEEQVTRPIGFSADKVDVAENGSVVKSKPLRKKLQIELLSRTSYESLIDNLLPNQTKFGGAVGDYHFADDDYQPSARIRRIQQFRQLEENRRLWRQQFAESFEPITEF